MSVIVFVAMVVGALTVVGMDSTAAPVNVNGAANISALVECVGKTVAPASGNRPTISSGYG